MRIWKNWDEEEKAVAVKLTGAFFLVAAIFVFISIVSYLFSWKQDASLLSEGGIMENATNAAGSLGFRTGHFLVSELFGIGSLALLIILLAISVRLLSGKWQSSLARTGIITLFGAFMASLALSYIGSLLGMETAFDGGLGGRCGAFCITWMTRTLGVIVTGLVIAVLIAIFLVLSSKKFSRWLSTLGSGKKKSKKKSKEPAVTDSDIEATPQEPDMPVVQDFLPEEQPEPELESEPVEELPTEPQAVTLAEKESVPEGNFEIISDDSLNAEVTEELKPIDNRLDPPDGLPKYKFPTLDLLEAHAGGRREVSSEELTRNNNKIRAALANYKIQLNDVKAQVGPTVTLY